MITEEEIKVCIDWKVYADMGCDPDGRPIVYCKLRLIDIAQADVTSCSKFMIYVLDKVCSKFAPNVDQFIYVYDCEGMGYSNFNMSIMTSCMKMT